MHNSELVETDVYFVEGVSHMYLSLSRCKKLCLVDEDFPLNNTKHRSNTVSHSEENVDIGAIVEGHGMDQGSEAPHPNWVPPKH